MATTINGTTSSNSYWVFKIVVTENSTSITNNTSSVTVEAFIGRSSERETSSYIQGANISCPVSITGCSNKTISYSNSNSVTLAPGEWLSIGSVTFSSVPHNDDGSKTVTVSASFTSNVSPSSGSASGSITLTAIPRKSTLTVSNGTLGKTQTLTVTRKSTNFTHTIKAACGNASTTVCSKSSSTSISFTPPLSWASQNTTGTSVTVVYTITTYNGDASVGSNSYTVVCTIPSSVKPSVSISISDVMGYTSTYGGYIKGLSKFKIDLTETPAYSSEIASRTITANGSTYTHKPVTTDVIKSSGTLTISASVTDKRGRSGSASTTVTVLDYAAPIISLLKVNRCNDDGTENAQGECIKVTWSGTVTSLSNKNTAQWVLYYKKSTDGDYTSVKLSSGTTFTMSNATYILAADTGSSYNIKLSVIDNFTTISKETVASTAFTMMHFNATGNGMAIGKVAENEELLDIGLNTKFNGDVFGTVMGMGYLPDILDNEDLNDYTTIGAYRINSHDRASTISNIPVLLAGRFKVETAIGEEVNTIGGKYSYLLQTYYDIHGYKYTREIYTTGTVGVWNYGSWERHLTDSCVVDNLTSDSKKLPLSANQGKVLNNKVENLENKISKGKTVLWTGNTGDNSDITLDDDYVNYNMLILCYKSSDKLYSIMVPTEQIVDSSVNLPISHVVALNMDVTFFQWGARNITMYMNSALTLYAVYGV